MEFISISGNVNLNEQASIENVISIFDTLSSFDRCNYDLNFKGRKLTIDAETQGDFKEIFKVLSSLRQVKSLCSQISLKRNLGEGTTTIRLESLPVVLDKVSA